MVEGSTSSRKLEEARQPKLTLLGEEETRSIKIYYAAVHGYTGLLICKTWNIKNNFDVQFRLPLEARTCVSSLYQRTRIISAALGNCLLFRETVSILRTER